MTAAGQHIPPRRFRGKQYGRGLTDRRHSVFATSASAWHHPPGRQGHPKPHPHRLRDGSIGHASPATVFPTSRKFRWAALRRPLQYHGTKRPPPSGLSSAACNRSSIGTTELLSRSIIAIIPFICPALPDSGHADSNHLTTFPLDPVAPTRYQPASRVKQNGPGCDAHDQAYISRFAVWRLLAACFLGSAAAPRWKNGYTTASRWGRTSRSQRPRSPTTGSMLTTGALSAAREGDAWWNTFDDPTLDSLIETAYRQNLDLKTAGTRVLQAQAQRNIAAGNLFPADRKTPSATMPMRKSARTSICSAIRWRLPDQSQRLGHRFQRLLGARFLGPAAAADRIVQCRSGRLGRGLSRCPGHSDGRRGHQLRPDSHVPAAHRLRQPQRRDPAGDRCGSPRRG